MALPAERLNLISLCTGGGGLDLGIGLALPNAHPVVLVEREAFALGHLVAAIEQGLLAEAAIWSDVRTFAGRPWRGIVDGLIGGIPCQPHSLAGKRLGEEDERDLWSDARRIIVQARPWFVVIENVEGMLTSGGAERVVRDLRRLGYQVEIGLFSASEAGASHQRNRVFIVAVADAGCLREQRRRGAGDVPGPSGAGEGERHQRQRHGHAAGDGSEDVAAPDHARLEGHGLAGECAAELPAGQGGGAMDDATRLGDRPISIQQGQSGRCCLDAAGASAGDAVSLFPPGPSDLDGWRRVLEDSPHLEPAVRRMADGVAARLDLAGPHAARIERLRLLGNGVVCLEAAYAFRTLVSRLAANGSAAAALLVRMMELEA